MEVKTRISQVFVRATPPEPLLGFGEDEDVSGFSVSENPNVIRFIPVKKGAADPFFLHRDSWLALGEPRKIRISVEAEEE